MLQLCYASRRVESSNDLLKDLSDILATARQFNSEQDIVGVLYYAEGYFFQCLEGRENVVEELFNRILLDHRHERVYRFPDRHIQHAHFADWSMKYVHKHSEIASLFKRHGFSQFRPDQMSDEQLQEMLKILFKVDENYTNFMSPKMGYKQRGYVPYF